MGQATQPTREDVQRLTARLHAEYDRLTAMHADARPDPDPAQADPGDEADLAEGQRSDTVSASHTDVDDRELAQVRRALDKLAEGTYGLSDLTDEPIPLERLEVIPWATANVDELEDEAPAGVRDIQGARATAAGSPRAPGPLDTHGEAGPGPTARSGPGKRRAHRPAGSQWR